MITPSHTLRSKPALLYQYNNCLDNNPDLLDLANTTDPRVLWILNQNLIQKLSQRTLMEGFLAYFKDKEFRKKFKKLKLRLKKRRKLKLRKLRLRKLRLRKHRVGVQPDAGLMTKTAHNTLDQAYIDYQNTLIQPKHLPAWQPSPSMRPRP